MMKASATVLANAVLLIVYFAAAEFGLSFFALIHPSASAVWLPTGIAMAALLIGGFRLLPAVFAGAFLAKDTSQLETLRSEQMQLGDSVSRRMLQAMIDSAEVLTPEQRSKAAERWQKRMPTRN